MTALILIRHQCQCEIMTALILIRYQCQCDIMIALILIWHQFQDDIMTMASVSVLLHDCIDDTEMAAWILIWHQCHIMTALVLIWPCLIMTLFTNCINTWPLSLYSLQ